MRNKWFGLAAAVLAAGFALAAEQVGTVTASGAIKLRGAEVPATGAQALPVVSGDEIETADHSAILVMSANRVTLAAESRVKVTRMQRLSMVGLMRGALQFMTTGNPRLMICALERLITPAWSSAGTVTIEDSEKVRIVAEKGSVEVDENRKCSHDGSLVMGFLQGQKAVVEVVPVVAAAKGKGPPFTPPGPPFTPPGPPPKAPPVSPPKKNP